MPASARHVQLGPSTPMSSSSGTLIAEPHATVAARSRAARITCSKRPRLLRLETSHAERKAGAILDCCEYGVKPQMFPARSPQTVQGSRQPPPRAVRLTAAPRSTSHAPYGPVQRGVSARFACGAQGVGTIGRACMRTLGAKQACSEPRPAGEAMKPRGTAIARSASCQVRSSARSARACAQVRDAAIPFRIRHASRRKHVARQGTFIDSESR